MKEDQISDKQIKAVQVCSGILHIPVPDYLYDMDKKTASEYIENLNKQIQDRVPKKQKPDETVKQDSILQNMAIKATTEVFIRNNKVLTFDAGEFIKKAKGIYRLFLETKNKLNK